VWESELKNGTPPTQMPLFFHGPVLFRSANFALILRDVV
jgi:hypothetical protein